MTKLANSVVVVGVAAFTETAQEVQQLRQDHDAWTPPEDGKAYC